MTAFWLSWYLTKEMGAFELESPWWVSGARVWQKGDEIWTDDSIVAAVRAESEEAAKELVLASFDKRPEAIEWRFCEPRPDGWAPFSERFPRGDWMKWL